MSAQPSRREILKQTAGAAVSLTVLAGCQARKQETALVSHGTVNIGPASQFLAGTANTSYQKFFGIVVTNDGGTVTAIQPICTHAGCTVAWDADHSKFACPCHGSEFDIQGLVLRGPARKPLARVPTIPNADGTLSVDLDRLSQPVKKA